MALGPKTVWTVLVPAYRNRISIQKETGKPIGSDLPVTVTACDIDRPLV